MKQQKCIIKNCNNLGIIMFAGQLICGECFMKIQEKQKNRDLKLLKELENE